MKVLIIDDERLARVEMKRLLEPVSYVELAGEAANAEEAIEIISELNPDLLLLDIQMPGKNGFELLEELDSVPEVIFTTAYDEYAIQAFDYNALAYLLKPIEQRDLLTAVSKAYEKITYLQQIEKTQPLLKDKDQIFVKDGERCWFIRLGDVKCFISEGNYVRICFDKFHPLILKSLNSIDERLDKRFFFRANRSCIINLKWIESIEPSLSGGLSVKLMDGSERIEISRRQTQKFKDMMSL